MCSKVPVGGLRKLVAHIYFKSRIIVSRFDAIGYCDWSYLFWAVQIAPQEHQSMVAICFITFSNDLALLVCFLSMITDKSIKLNKTLKLANISLIIMSNV